MTHKCSCCGQPATHNEGGVKLVCNRCCQNLQTDPTVSHWLKRALWDLQQRDPVDALRDAELLLAAIRARHSYGYPPRHVPLSPELYVENKGTFCPYCGSKELVGDEIEKHPDAAAFQPITCLDCRKMWNDQFRLVGYSPIS